MSMQLDPIVSKKLKHFAKRRFRLLVVRGLSAGMITFLLAMSVAAFADWYWLLTEQTRWALSSGSYLLTLITFWSTSLRQLVHVPAREEIAAQVEQEEPELREKLLSAVELATDDPQVIHDSPVFRSLLQGQVAEMMGNIRVGTLLPIRLVAKWIVLAVLLGGVAAFLLTSSDVRFRQLATRAILPGANISRVSRIQVEILQPTPHSLLLAEDETVAIVVDISGGEVDDVILETFSQEGESKQLSMRNREDQVFATNLHVDESLEYRILAGDAITQKYRIDSRPRPHVTAFQKIFEYPSYAQLEPKTISEPHGDLLVLEGTQATLNLSLDQDVSEAELQVEFGDAEEFTQISLTQAEENLWSVTIPVEETGVYKVRLVSKETGFENIFSPKYAIDPQPDLIPRAGFLEQSATTLLLPPNDLVDLKAMAEDDLPVVSLDQLISVNGQEWESISLPIEQSEQNDLQVTSDWQWDLLNLKLETGDQVLTKLVATDRKGNQGESIPLRIVIASPDFDPQRHQITQRKLGFSDELSALEKQLADQEKTAHQVIDQMLQPDRSEEQQETDQITLIDLATKQREEARRLFEGLREMIRDMPPGADSYDLELTGQVLAKLELQSANNSIALLKMMHHAKDSKAIEHDVQQLKRTFTQSADDAKNLAAHYQVFSTHNFLAAIAHDFAALLEQQQYVVESPSQSWERLLRQETVVINQLQQVEDFITNHRSRVTSSIDRHTVSLINWCNSYRNRLMENTESEDQLDALRRLSTDLLNQLKQKQRIDVIDGGIPGRIVNGRKDLINRAGSLYVPIDQIARAVQQEDRLLNSASSSKDTQEGESFLKEAERFSAEINLKQRPSLNQLRARRDLTQSRNDADAQYAADAGLTLRAVNWLMSQHRSEESDESLKVDECLLEVAPAYRTLEAGHQLILASHALNLLLNLERWDSQSLQGITEHPRQWDLVQYALELASQKLKEAKVENELASQVDSLRWSDAVREANRRIGERRWKRDAIVTAAHELLEVRENMNVILNNIQPVMQQARSVIAKYAPTIPELAEQAAEQVRELEEATIQSADSAEQKSEAVQQQQLADLQQQQAAVNQQIEDLFDAIVEDANAQDILDDQQRMRAQDADRSIAAIQEPAAEMNRELRDAEAANNAQQQAKELAQAAEQQEKTAQVLDLVAEHFSRLDEGLDVAETRSQLNNSDQPPQNLASQTAPMSTAQLQHAEDLAALANQDASELLAELEAELQRNPAMQQALSEISQSALEDARNALNLAAEDDQRLQQENERSDEEFRAKKRELAEDLRKMAAEASQLANTFVEQANQMSARGKTPDAQKRINEAKQKLNDVAAQANAAREEQLLADLAKNAQETQTALREATETLKVAKEQTNSGKDEQIHKDDKAKAAAKKDSENRAKQFHDQQKRTAQNLTKQANDAKRRADQNVKNIENQLRNIDRQIGQTQNNLKRRPDDNGLKQTLQRQQQQKSTEEAKLKNAKETLQAAAQKSQQAKQHQDQINRKPLPPLNAANPATELADRHVEEAIKAAEELNRKADQLAQTIDFGNELTPAQNQLANSQKQQGLIIEDVQQAADDVARASRHEMRLNNPTAAQPLQQHAEKIEQVANNEATTAEKQLEEAVGEAENNSQEDQQSQNAEALKAQTDLANSEAALAEQANQLGEQVAALIAAAEQGTPGTPTANASENAQGGQRQTNGESGEQPLTSGELDRGRQLAQALDELDRQMAQAPQAPINTLDSLAQAAQARQAAMAAARAKTQQTAIAAMSESGFSDEGIPPETGASADFNVTFVHRQDGKDWGKLRQSSAKDAMIGSSQAIAEEYRESIEAYFKVLAERARKQK